MRCHSFTLLRNISSWGTAPCKLELKNIFLSFPCSVTWLMQPPHQWLVSDHSQNWRLYCLMFVLSYPKYSERSRPAILTHIHALIFRYMSCYIISTLCSGTAGTSLSLWLILMEQTQASVPLQRADLGLFLALQTVRLGWWIQAACPFHSQDWNCAIYWDVISLVLTPQPPHTHATF